MLASAGVGDCRRAVTTESSRQRRSRSGFSPPTGFLLHISKQIPHGFPYRTLLCARGDLNPHALAGTGT